MQGTPHHEKILELGPTPKILIDHCDFPDIPLAIKASTISKIVFDHGISTSVVQGLYDVIENSKLIFKSANQRDQDSVVVLTLEVKGLSPIIIPIRKNQTSGRKKFNFITSVYAKEGPNPEVKWKRDNLLLWEGT
jgi:hypothetical protein